MRIWSVAFALVALWGCSKKKPAPESAAASTTPVAQPAAARAGAAARPRDIACDGADRCLPDWDFATLDGRSVPASATRGKVVLVLFWASWCEPCTAENGGLSGVYARHKSAGFELLGISRDDSSDAKLLEWAAHYNLKFPIIRATPEILTAFGEPEVVPTTMLFDRQGNRTWRLTGVADTALIEQDVAALVRGEEVKMRVVRAPNADAGASQLH